MLAAFAAALCDVVALMDGFVHACIWIQLEAINIVIILIVPVLPLLVTAVLSYFVG